jgi:ferredoxin
MANARRRVWAGDEGLEKTLRRDPRNRLINRLKWAPDPNTIPSLRITTRPDESRSIRYGRPASPSPKAHLQRGLMAGLYCQGCGQCLSRCVQALPIPDLMRAYMYVYGYRNIVAAQDLVTSLELPLKVCEDCDSCAVSCAIGFRVQDRIRNVVRLREVSRIYA